MPSELELVHLVTTFLFHDPTNVDALLFVARTMLFHSSGRVRWWAAHALTKRGKCLSQEENEKLALGIRSDLAVVILRLGFYAAVWRSSPAFRPAREEHILWLVENYPEWAFAGSPDIYPCRPGRRSVCKSPRDMAPETIE